MRLLPYSQKKQTIRENEPALPVWGSCSVLLLLFLASIATSCGSSLKVLGKSKGAYTEDLVKHRIKFEHSEEIFFSKPKKKKKRITKAAPIYDSTSELDGLLDSMKESDAAIQYIKVYTLQVYAGSNRKAALSAKHKLNTLDSPIRSELIYKQPNYIVRVGKFLDELAAQKMYMRIKKLLPNTIVRLINVPNTAKVVNHMLHIEMPHKEAEEYTDLD